MTTTITPAALSRRDRAVLLAVRAGRCEVSGGAAVALTVDPAVQRPVRRAPARAGRAHRLPGPGAATRSAHRVRPHRSRGGVRP